MTTQHSMLKLVMIQMKLKLRIFNWDSETRTKAQGLLRTMQTPVHAISFITVMFTLEPVKPLTVKLQQRNQDILQTR